MELSSFPELRGHMTVISHTLRPTEAEVLGYLSSPIVSNSLSGDVLLLKAEDSIKLLAEVAAFVASSNMSPDEAIQANPKAQASARPTKDDRRAAALYALRASDVRDVAERLWGINRVRHAVAIAKDDLAALVVVEVEKPLGRGRTGARKAWRKLRRERLAMAMEFRHHALRKSMGLDGGDVRDPEALKSPETTKREVSNLDALAHLDALEALTYGTE